MEILLLGFFLFFAFINLCYFLVFSNFAFSKSQSVKPVNLPVSVVVCAKNEAENLRNFLPAILEQEYPNFEVIVINDASIDETLEVIENFQQIDPRLQLVNVQNNEAFWANKKYALTLGIKKAQNPYLLFTDADCAPQSKNWISAMAQHFTETKDMVLGYGGYFKQQHSLLNKVIRFETLLTALQYFSYAKVGKAYMGVGRNLAYTSKLFYEQKGFASHLHIRSGDDDLFVNEAATAQNTAISYHPESITRSVPKKSLRTWFMQKRRHTSTAKHYKLWHQAVLGLFYTSRLLFWLLLPVLLIIGSFNIIVLSSLGVLLLVEFFVYLKTAQKLGESDVVWLFPFLEVFLIFTQLGIFITNIFSKPKHWR